MAAGSVALFGAPTVAQVDEGSDDAISAPVPLSVDPATGDPYASDHRRPSISADGTIVVFEAATDAAAEPDPADGSGEVVEPDVVTDPDVILDPGADGAADDVRIAVADRLADTVTDLAGQRLAGDPEGTVTVAPAVSGDGCRVAFSALLPASGDDPSTTAELQLRVVDRCSDSDVPPAASTVDTITVLAAEVSDPADPADGGTTADGTTTDGATARDDMAVPALSADGSTIAWSTGQEVRRYTLEADGTWIITDRIDATPPADPDPTDPTDPDTDPTDPGAPPVDTDPTSDDMVTEAAISLSADGTTLAFAAGPGGVPFRPEPANVYVWSISSGTPTIELASMTIDGTPGAADSTAPSLSADGQLLVFESSSTDLAAAGGAGSDPTAEGEGDVETENAAAGSVTTPFVVMLDRGNGTGVLASDARRPVISADGRHVVHTRAGALVRTTWVDGTPFAVTTDTEVAPVAPLSRPGVSQHGRWVVFDSDDGPALTDDERFAQGGHVWIADLRPDGSIPDVTTTTTAPPVTDPTTTDPTSTGPTTSDPTTTGPTTTNSESNAPVDPPESSTSVSPTTVPVTQPDFDFPPLRLPSSPPPTRPPSTGSSSGGTTTVPEPPPAFDTTEVRFADAIVAAGRSTATVTLSNPGSDPVDVSALRVEPATDTPFMIVSETCTAAPLPASGTCSIELEFRPTEAGTTTATLIAETDSSGGAIAVAVTGDGIGPPVLDVVPDVAMPGQVVTVFGSGFPADVTVDFSWGLGTAVTHADAQTEPITVDADGSFVHVVVVLPNTLPGPVPVRVPGQVDLFADVEAELLVSGSRGSFSAAIRAGSTFVR